MDSILTTGILKALSEGNAKDFFGYLLIFTFIWVEVRSVKKEIASLKESVNSRMSDLDSCDERIDTVEREVAIHETRLMAIEYKFVKDKGG